MSRDLHPVDPPARPRRLNNRAEIAAWIAERRAVLTALVEAERGGQRQLEAAEDDVQLRLGEVA